MTPAVQSYWDAFRKLGDCPGAILHDVYQVGDTPQSADAGLRLILEKTKTATSALPEEFVDIGLPQKGWFCIVTDGLGRPGAVVETVDVVRKPFSQVDAEFAHAYGEWDRTLETWREKNGAYYKTVCDRLNMQWHEDRDLICETFTLASTQTMHSQEEAKEHG